MCCPWLYTLAVRQFESAKQRRKNREQRVRSRLVLELLEQRSLLSASGLIASQAGINLLRVSQADYADGMSAPSQPLAPMGAMADDEMGACFFSDGTCEQLTQGSCEAAGGISWEAGAPCPCTDSQTTDGQMSTSNVFAEMIPGGGQALPRSNSTATAFALLAGTSKAGMFMQSSVGVPSTPPVAARTPIMMITDKGPDTLPVGGTVRSVAPAAETANLDAFWRQYGANDQRTVSLGSLDSGAAGYVGS
jgi:hypothetical protein